MTIMLSIDTTKWQVAYQVMFSQPKDAVSFDYDSDSSFRQLPLGCDNPKDWDGILKGDGIRIRLAVSPGGRLNLDDGTEENPNIVTPAIGEDTRGLRDCFILALREWWVIAGEHHPKLHSSWYEMVETFVDTEEQGEGRICPECAIRMRPIVDGWHCDECDQSLLIVEKYTFR